MRIQTITIQLKLKDGQEPYSNDLEFRGGTQPAYDSLKMFFEEFGPPSYEVADIESKVDEEPRMSALEAGILAGIIEFELDHPRDGRPNHELSDAHAKLIEIRDGNYKVVKA